MTTYNYIKIPVDSVDPHYKFSISLSGVIFVLTLRYNLRMDRWMLDLADASNVMLYFGLPLLFQRNPLERFADSRLPAGVFFVVDETAQGTDPTRYSWGSTHSLYYADPVVV